MRYGILVIDPDGDAGRLSRALSMHSPLVEPTRSVYVVGEEDSSALAHAIGDGKAIGEEPVVYQSLDAKTALRFPFTEAIGTESFGMPYDHLISLARRRLAQLTQEKT